MNRKSIIWIAVAAACVLLVLLGILLATGQKDRGGDTSYLGRITAGQKFLDAGDYDHAILEFKAAVELEPAQDTPYIGLFKSYYGGNYLSLARDTLIRGIEATDSNILREHLVQYFPDAAQQLFLLSEPETAPQEKATDQPVGKLSLSTELLQFLSGATYQDYKNLYPDITAEMADGRSVAHTSHLDADIIFENTSTERLIDASSGQPYPEVMPSEIVFRNMVQIFGTNTVLYEELRRLPDVQSPSKSDGKLTFTACGCSVIIDCDEQGNISADSGIRIIPLHENTETAVVHVLTGRVIDATSGNSVSGVSMTFTATLSGNIYETESDSIGNYRLETEESGSYTVRLTKNGYITEDFSIYVADASDEVYNSFTISPLLGTNEIRIVLTWGSAPSDLDSHLSGTASDGTGVHVYFSNQKVTNRSGSVVAELDVDDTSAYGPETTTIYDTSGSFLFYVEDYTQTIGVGPSGATIKIYQGSSLIYTLTPGSSVGRIWNVCKIENGRITILNY